MSKQIPTPAQEPFRIRTLRGAICEYLDEGDIDEMMDDMKSILQEEMDRFAKQHGYYRTVMGIIAPETKTIPLVSPVEETSAAKPDALRFPPLWQQIRDRLDLYGSYWPTKIELLLQIIADRLEKEKPAHPVNWLLMESKRVEF
jgi:hypothetical protein